MDKETVLQEANRLVYGDRAAKHGDFRSNFQTTAALFNAWTGIEITPKQVAQLLICVKQARYKDNPEHRDNLVDLSGYTELLSRL